MDNGYQLLPVTMSPRLPNLTIEDMKNYLTADNDYPDDVELTFEATLLYLGHLCCRQKYNDVNAFLDNLTPEECGVYLNARPDMFWCGTLLHVLLQWNYTPFTMDMYITLRARGAIPCIDYYGNLPWQDMSPLLCAPGDRTQYGGRNPAMFHELYHEVAAYEDWLISATAIN